MSVTRRRILVLRGAFSFVVLPPLRGGGRGAWSPIWLYVALTNHQRRGKDLPFYGIVLVERKNDRGAASQAHQQRQLKGRASQFEDVEAAALLYRQESL